ncbi:MAG: heparan-alpha-glucosaminide N-acetyltransferase [Clostridiales bacterium]
MNSKRIWELDFLRGLSLIIMIYYHIVFDLEFIFSYPVSVNEGVNYYAGKIALVFILVSGISSTLSKNKVKRGIKLLIVSLILTLVTYLFSPILNSYVLFGILHLLAFSIIISSIFSKIKPIFSFLTGIIIIYFGTLIENITTSIPFLFPFGITTDSFISSDYFPLIPWFGYYLLGMYIGRIFYKEKVSIFKFQIKNNFLNLMGKHSLTIYLIHQPIILLILFLINGALNLL